MMSSAYSLRFLFRAALSGALAVVALCLVEGAATAELQLEFSDKFEIDRSRFATRDMSKPFYFSVIGPSFPGDPSPDGFRFTVDKGTNFNVWLDPTVQPHNRRGAGERSLAVQITADYDENVKDKIMFQINPKGGDKKLDIIEPVPSRFVRFDFMLDRDYDTPHNWLLHFQAWQCCGGVPPFTIHVQPSNDKNSGIEFVFLVVDDKDRTANPFGMGREIYRMPVARGEWKSMALMLDPSFDDSGRPGEIAMWLDGDKKFDWRGNWGFRPEQSAPNHDGKMTPEMDLNLGVYRRRQTTTQTIYFNNIRFGGSLGDVLEGSEASPRARQPLGHLEDRGLPRPHKSPAVELKAIRP
jgi:hypothetical protein